MNVHNESPESPRGRILLRLVAFLWLIWGAVHMFAGIMTIQLGTADSISGIADAVSPETLAMEYPDAVGALINQHGFNLLWIGAFTAICAPFIWKGSRQAIWAAAIVGGLTDLGYFVFIDLGGFVHFVPGTVMTIISGTAIILGAIVARPRTVQE